jgi:ParB/RepB/Spo0J family partition protein
MSETITTIPLSLIDEPRYLLRTVQRQSIEYLELRSSIEKYGLLTAVLVRPVGDRFRMVGGNYRRTVCVDLRRTDMPCIVREMTDIEEIALQLQENAVRYATKPCEFANQLERLMEQSPGMTFYDLAGMVSKSPGWIKRLLKLTALDRETQKLVDRGQMTVENAMKLAKIPKQFRDQHIDNACSMTVAEFKPLAASLIKQYAEGIREGKLDARFLSEFKPAAWIRAPSEIKAEIDNPLHAPMLIVSEGCKTLLDAWLSGARWSIHLDRESIAAQREKAIREGRLESEDDAQLDSP